MRNQTFIDPSSKTFWAGAGLVGFGLYTIFAVGDADAGIQQIMQGFGLMFLRHAVAKL